MQIRIFTTLLLSFLAITGVNLSAQENTPSENKASPSMSDLKKEEYINRIQRYGHGFSEPNDFTLEE